MAKSEIELENRRIVLKAPVPRLNFARAVIEEGLSEPLRARVEFVASNQQVDFAQLLGKDMGVHVEYGKDKWREFHGICTELEYLGRYQGLHLYSAEVRSWFWLLTLTENNRVFQNQTVDQIAKAILGEAGFSNFKFTLDADHPQRSYTIQYGESDFAFLSRLFEEEGIYYFSTCKGGKETVNFVDGIGGHAEVPEAKALEFFPAEESYRRTTDHFYDWASADRVTTGKVTLTDYDFEKPRADLASMRAMPKGSHSYKDMEAYRAAGGYRVAGEGTALAKVEMERRAVRHQTRRGVCNVKTMAVGHFFTLDGHVRSSENAEYLVTRAVHRLQTERGDEKDVEDHSILTGRLPHDPANKDEYRAEVQVIPKRQPFRPEAITPKPAIPGILLAKVVGPAGEEVHTDKYGRIKIQFPWDRKGKKNETSSCFVRCVMPWVGKNWGFVSIPRIGQEVAIQFEDGNPDRPICTGMLYNADNMPPYDLPGNMTQTGIKTNSSKGGGGFNELMFEDKKGSELVRMQSEKDFTQIIKNNATVTIGLEKKDKGDLTQTIQNNKTEKLLEGDHTFEVAKGQETRKIARDQTETIGKNRKTEIKANDTLEVDGSRDLSIRGSQTTAIRGSETVTTRGSSDWTVTGSITIESKASITLKVGASKIEITPAGITVTGMTVTTDAKMAATHKTSGAMTIQGLTVMIN